MESGDPDEKAGPRLKFAAPSVDRPVEAESLVKKTASALPYSAPRPPAEVSPGTLASLAATAPWVRFLGTLVWISGGLAAIGTVVLLGMAFYFEIWSERTGGVEMLLSAGGNAIRAGLLLSLASRIGAYSRSLDLLAVTKRLANLESALDEQRLIWRFCGILALVQLALLVIGLLVGGVALLTTL